MQCKKCKSTHALGLFVSKKLQKNVSHELAKLDCQFDIAGKNKIRVRKKSNSEREKIRK